MSENKFSVGRFNAFAAKEITRLATLKHKLIRESERFALEKAIERYGNATLLHAEPQLIQSEQTNGYETLIGSVSITVQIKDGSNTLTAAIPIIIEEEQPRLPEGTDIAEFIIESLPEKSAAVASLALKQVVASLDQFRLIEEPAGTLKVYHEAYDMGEKPVTLLDAVLYNTSNQKEQLLLQALLEAFNSSDAVKTHELQFEGRFTEPTVQKVAVEVEPLPTDICECNLIDCPTHPRGACISKATTTLQRAGDEDALTYHFCEPCAKQVHSLEEDVLDLGDKGDTLDRTLELDFERGDEGQRPLGEDEEELIEDLRYRSPDFRRRLEETQKQTIQRQCEKLSFSVGNALVNHFLNLHYSDIKLIGVNSNQLQYSAQTQSFSGSLHITASLTSKLGERVINLTLPVTSGNFKLPTSREVFTAIEGGIDLRAGVAKEVALEQVSALAEIDQKEEAKATQLKSILLEGLEKTAAEHNSTQLLGPNTVMHLNKHLLGLPEDTKIGTIIFADGAHWKLIDKNRQQLSAGQNDGSIWSFEKVEAGNTLPEYRLDI